MEHPIRHVAQMTEMTGFVSEVDPAVEGEIVAFSLAGVNSAGCANLVIPENLYPSRRHISGRA